MEILPKTILGKWLIKNVSLKDYGNFHEKLNSWTHLIPAVFILFSLIFLVVNQFFNPSKYFWSISIYGISMLVLYGSSAIYHGLKNPIVKRFFRMLDHTNIYILIAGTYTPLMIAADERLFLILVWLLAIIGILTTFLFWEKFKVLHVISYLALGWVVVLIVKPLFFGDIFEIGLLWFSIAGGLFYSFGVILYAIKKIPYNHAIWHIFVFCGSASFFLGIIIYILPIK